MKLWGSIVLLTSALASPVGLLAQTPQVVRGADERMKADILVIVAHPDDEAAVTPYLARAIYDLHKRVAVVFATRGGSGGNDYSREHGLALANIRETEAREACAKLGISNVWFLDGKDTASQNVLNSLANWGHGSNLEKLVDLFRLTRPEIVITWLPSVFIGENHGDHQAAGVLATEAFDLSGNPIAFPAQVGGASKRLEPYLENLMPGQAQKIYYFSDANDSKQFVGKGPAYSVKEISPSQKKPYWRMALEAAKPHRTQFPADIERISKLSDAQLEKMMSDPNTGWWTEPMTLIFGKAIMPTAPTADVFANIQAGAVAPSVPAAKDQGPKLFQKNAISLGGPWGYYAAFRVEHSLGDIPVAPEPEIAVKSHSSVYVPIIVHHADVGPLTVSLRVEAPSGWKVTSGQGSFSLPAEPSTALQVEVETPLMSPEELKTAKPQEITVRAEKDGASIGEVKLRVQLQASALPQ
ncbi:MAG TPA: PIG-L family deacetylase [Candidatus Acidoferrum sp.]|jgi:LmbE family N-acetylglucosaminyl deacetylase